MLLTLLKTPCFGDCPVYDAYIDKDGNVYYHGLEYVTEVGVRTFKITDEELKELNSILAKKDFDSFAGTYDNPEMTDLPSTFILDKKKEVKIRLWKDIPDALIELQEAI